MNRIREYLEIRDFVNNLSKDTSHIQNDIFSIIVKYSEKNLVTSIYSPSIRLPNYKDKFYRYLPPIDWSNHPNLNTPRIANKVLSKYYDNIVKNYWFFMKDGSDLLIDEYLLKKYLNKCLHSSPDIRSLYACVKDF